MNGSDILQSLRNYKIMEAENNEFSNTVCNSLKPFPYQVAGHFYEEPFKIAVDGCVLKPVQRPPKGEREVAFYETIFDKKEDREVILQLRRFLPCYYGVVELDSSRYLKLENITIKFHLPCVMDIKVGKVTWENDAKKEFKERRKKNWPLKERAGFCIAGYMVYNHEMCCHEHFTRELCETLATVEDIERTFHKFLGGMDKECTQCILEQLMAKLTEIQQWFRTQRLYRFIASSILIAYEAGSQNTRLNGGNSIHATSSVRSDDQSFSDDMQDSNAVPHRAFTNHQNLLAPNKTLVEARIIDTAHVFSSSDVDSNYLFGLENIISTVECIQKNQ